MKITPQELYELLCVARENAQEEQANTNIEREVSVIRERDDATDRIGELEKFIQVLVEESGAPNSSLLYDTIHKQKTAEAKYEQSRRDYNTVVGQRNAAQQELLNLREKIEADAELGRLVRDMPKYRRLQRQTNDWYASDEGKDGKMRPGVTGATPEEALTKAG